MCRLVAYLGEPIPLDAVVCTPAHSLLRQSLRAHEARTVTNGDGFGVGWYGEGPEPGVYREVMPAWSDQNLQSLCATVRSRLFFAHVRASTGTAIARQNCHPFRYGHWLFMHNGQIGGYALVRRALEAMLPDPMYAARQGATDSELLFLLTMARIEAGEDAEFALQSVLEHTLKQMRSAGIDEPLRFTAVLSDGEEIHAVRYASDGQPPSLYVGENEHGRILASEPLDGQHEHWQPIPPGGGVRLRVAPPAPAPAQISSLVPSSTTRLAGR